jgi:hypothetical protein
MNYDKNYDKSKHIRKSRQNILFLSFFDIFFDWFLVFSTKSSNSNQHFLISHDCFSKDCCYLTRSPNTLRFPRAARGASSAQAPVGSPQPRPPAGVFVYSVCSVLSTKFFILFQEQQTFRKQPISLIQ